MEFYHDTVTDKSFAFLQVLQRSYSFILIGGWSFFLYTNALKSKDIDIIVDYDVLGALKEKFAVHKNERLKKYEIKTGEFDADIYAPHYSDLGVGVEAVIKTAVSRSGFTVPKLETLFALKLYAWKQRRGTIKGRKDELDLFSLAFLPEFQFEKIDEDFIILLSKMRSIPELKLNEQMISKLRKRIL